MKETVVFLVLVVFGLLSFGDAVWPPVVNVTRTYENYALLSASPHYEIHWTIDGNSLKLGIVCETEGWCGFGFSEFGAMIGSDAIIGSFDTTNGLLIVDYLLGAKVEPGSGSCPTAVCPDIYTPGCTDNVFNKTGSRTQNFTVLEYERPVLKSDACDRAIPVNPADRENIIFSSGPGDAIHVMKHFFRSGTTSPGFWNWSPNTRIYYVAVEEVSAWDYIPKGRDPGAPGATWISPGPDRIGHIYTKAQYFEYVDPNYNIRKNPAEFLHAGILGPVLRAEVGEIIIILFKNKVPAGGRNYTMIPHGALYDANNEGLPKDGVPPGGTAVYTWFVPDRAGPGPNDPSSVMWLYHSNVAPEKDINTGLIGPVIITRRGASTDVGNRKPIDVDREFIKLYSIFDENQSHYLGTNMAGLASPPAISDPGFIESNRKRTINGYMYDNSDDFVMNIGEKVRWYVAAVGDVSDIHTPHWHAQTVVSHNTHSDSVSILPSEMMQVDMVPDNAGTWSMHCHVNSHTEAGMHLQFTVTGTTTVPTVTGQTRQYYIAAEEVLWNYTPVKSPLPQGAAYLTRNQTRIGSTYYKVIYQEYTDATFTTPKAVPSQWTHKGILGPIIQAQVGDLILIKFKNNVVNTTTSFSMHAHGVFYDSASEGTAGVAPGAVYDYTWYVPARAGPGPNDPSSILWLYHSHVSGPADMNTGLVGGIIVTRSGSGRSAANPSPTDVDREFITVYTIFDENVSPYLDMNINTFANTASVVKTDPYFIESNMKSTINGLMFNNIQGFQMNVGERVRWYVAALGDEEDLHSPHWHAQIGTEHGIRSDVVEVIPAQVVEVDMIVDNPGTWKMHCHVNEHNTNGMFNNFIVNGTAGPFTPLKTRMYYIAAEEVDWDYAPTNRPAAGNQWIQKGPDRVGSVYRKLRYVEYTDASFMYKKGMSSRWIHKGILGPIIRAEVGDRVVVNFMNKVMTGNRNFSVHPHGVFYDKNSEGATVGVPPGGTFTYIWNVPARAGPATNDGTSVVWLYHSHINSSSDMNSGLVGAIIVTKQGSARNSTELRPTDVDREFIMLLNVFDENLSHLLPTNIQQTQSGTTNPSNPGFVAANMKSAINGFIFDNAQGFTMNLGERVRWYLVAIGDEEDVHTVHWHGLAATLNGKRTDVTGLIPASMKEVDMIPDNLGIWTTHCHVNTHSLAGMMIHINVSAENIPEFYIADEIPPTVASSTEIVGESESSGSDPFPLLYIIIVAAAAFLLLLLAAILIVCVVRRKHKKDLGGFY